MHNLGMYYLFNKEIYRCDDGNGALDVFNALLPFFI